jgi:predicted extracellular nuclease
MLPVSKRANAWGDTVITTFNLENLFDLVHTPGKNDIGTGGADTPEALDVRLTKLALAIQVELALPEILIVQEVDDRALLQVLGNRVNRAAGTCYTATAFETSDERGLDVGFLWDAQRVTLDEALQLDDPLVPGVRAAFGPQSPSPGREPLVGRFVIKGQELTIIGNHFKSARGDDPTDDASLPFMPRSALQRKAQARVVRTFVNRLLEANPQALVLVAGDLNDLPGGQPGEGADHPLAILEGAPGEIPLTNLVRLVREDAPFTFITYDKPQLLDHLLVSPALLARFVAVNILHFNAGFPRELRDDPTTTRRASDHDPVEGRFAFAASHPLAL